MTRRSLLAAGAGALAGGLTRPGAVLAALGGPSPPRLSERRVGQLGRRAVTVELAAPADLVGVQWAGGSATGLQLRFRASGGRWSAWVAGGAHGHGPDAGAPGSGNIGDPVWTGGASAVQLRSSGPLSDVRLHLVDVSAGLGARRQVLALGPLANAAALPSATPVLAAGAGQPAIIARRAWAQGVAHPGVTPAYGSVQMAFVHHTENPNGYLAAEVPAMLRAIFAFHRYVNGWNDIGYNFVIDLFGRVFEARAGGIDEPVVGAHAGGYNLVSSGVAVLGSFMSVPISTPARRTLERLLAWKLSLHGVPSQGRVTVRVNPAGAVYSRFPARARVSLPRIAGHRDADTTDCPGNILYGELPALRAGVHRLALEPVRVTLAYVAATPGAPAPATPAPGAPAPGTPAEPSPAGTPAPATTPAPPAPGVPAMLTGTVALLDGTPIAGAPVQLQVRRVARKGEAVQEQPLAQLTSDAQGRFAAPAGFPGVSGASWLRALFPGAGSAGASISEPLRVSL
ncbi:MAG TPA: N-acetylmuramoyl-L-alanine amidase [Solirubrobacteraceae bacterium]